MYGASVRAVSSRAISRASLTEETTSAPAASYPGVRVTTMFVRPGSARPRASHERRPMMIGQPIVEDLK